MKEKNKFLLIFFFISVFLILFIVSIKQNGIISIDLMNKNTNANLIDGFSEIPNVKANSSVTIHFNGNGNDNTSYTYPDKTITAAASMRTLTKQHRFYKKGYILTHWNTKSNGTGTSYYQNLSVSAVPLSAFPSSNVTLYAQWKPCNSVLSYLGNGHTNTDAAIASVWATNGTKIQVKANPFKKTGYTFAGFKYDGKIYQPGDYISSFNATMKPVSETILTPSGFDYSDFEGDSNKYYYPQGTVLYEQNGKKYVGSYYISSSYSVSKTRKDSNGNPLSVDMHYFVKFDYETGKQVSIKKLGHYGHGNDMFFDKQTNSFYLVVQSDCSSPSYNKSTASIIQFNLNFDKVKEIALKNENGSRLKADSILRYGNYWYAKNSGYLYKYNSNFEYISKTDFSSASNLWINDVGVWNLSAQGMGANTNWIYGARFIGPTPHNFVTITKPDNSASYMFEYTFSDSNWSQRREIEDFDFDENGNLHIFSSGSLKNNACPVRMDKYSGNGIPHTYLIAQWNPINYTISYNLNGGTVSTQNKTSYTIETATFTLNNPTKTGYKFKGWTTTSNSTPTTTVKITKGTTGNLAYTAVWEKAPTTTTKKTTTTTTTKKTTTTTKKTTTTTKKTTTTTTKRAATTTTTKKTTTTTGKITTTTKPITTTTTKQTIKTTTTTRPTTTTKPQVTKSTTTTTTRPTTTTKPQVTKSTTTTTTRPTTTKPITTTTRPTTTTTTTRPTTSTTTTTTRVIDDNIIIENDSETETNNNSILYGTLKDIGIILSGVIIISICSSIAKRH